MENAIFGRFTNGRSNATTAAAVAIALAIGAGLGVATLAWGGFTNASGRLGFTVGGMTFALVGNGWKGGPSDWARGIAGAIVVAAVNVCAFQHARRRTTIRGAPWR
jgi:hypothetical protein